MEYKIVRSKIAEIENLYEEAFPPNERMNTEYLYKLDNHNKTYAFYQDNELIGFVSMIILNNIINLTYFAVVLKYRKLGYGTKILNIIKKIYRDKILIVDIEAINFKGNREVRVLRKKFYLKNGSVDTLIRRRWHEEDYETLAYNGMITDQEYEEFWDNFFQISR